MCRFLFALSVCLLLLPATLRAEEVPPPVPEAATADSGESPERKRHPLRDIEWASIGIGTGSFLVSARLSGPTLIWKHFYWTTLHLEWLMYQSRDIFKYGDFFGFGSLVTQSYGYPWRFDPSGKQELRVGALAGWFWSDNFPLMAHHEYEPGDRHRYYFRGWMGLGLGPELTYLYHFRKHLSLTAGFRSAFAVAGRGDYYPFPYLAAQVGLAF